MANTRKHTPEAKEKIRQSKLGKKQSPETIAARFAYLQNTVRVSRNDAAALEVARQYFENRNLANALDPLSFRGVHPMTPELEAKRDEFNRLCERDRDLMHLIDAWIAGENVLLAKLSQ